MNVTTTERSRVGGRVRDFLKLIHIEIIVNVIANRSIIHDISRVFSTMDPKNFNRCRGYWGSQSVPADPGMARILFKKEGWTASV